MKKQDLMYSISEHFLVFHNSIYNCCYFYLWSILFCNPDIQAGVITNEEFAIFQNAGYMGLYGGLDVDDIHTKKQLELGQKILDYMGSTELIANLFRISQTEEKLRKDNVGRII